ncbi:MAG: T9SS type A sorting domain-containing protein [Candidatus Kapabacteria bacterium]|jgi:photosystem II stability/assembly factor-like uncharacterized protein|nr:T9SS type A sorting domain-containing protein [Candidatus Kapabacteria bacterium]
MKYFTMSIYLKVLLGIIIILYFLLNSVNTFCQDKWETINSPSNENAMSLFVSSDNIFFFGSGQGIKWSSDNGNSWNNTTCESGWAHSIFDFKEDSQGRIYAVAASGVFKSTDKGKRWSMVKDDYMVRQIELDENDNLYITSSTQQGEYKLQYSSNHGQNWKVITPKNQTIEFLTLKVINSSLMVLSIGADLLYSNDKGETWELAGEVDEHFNFNSIIKTKTNIIANSFYQNFNQGLFESTDGKAWHKMTTIPESNYFRWIKYNTQADEIYSFDFISGINKSGGDGMNWMNFNDGLPSGIFVYDIAFGKDGFIYVSASDQHVYRRKSTINSINNDNVYLEPVFNVYPNPVIDNLIIEINNKEYFITENIEIFNINGRVIQNEGMIQYPGNRIKISALNLNSGIYYLRIRLNNKYYFKPFLVLK